MTQEADVERVAREFLDERRVYTDDAVRALLIMAITQERAAISAMQEWQPIETAPRDGTLIWVWDGERRWLASYEESPFSDSPWRVQGNLYEFGDSPPRLSLIDGRVEGAVSFMPLPAPPEDR